MSHGLALLITRGFHEHPIKELRIYLSTLEILKKAQNQEMIIVPEKKDLQIICVNLGPELSFPEFYIKLCCFSIRNSYHQKQQIIKGVRGFERRIHRAIQS